LPLFPQCVILVFLKIKTRNFSQLKAKTVPQIATAELCKDGPSCYAIALQEWRFESKRIAIRAGQVVQLEFNPSMVVVHDALQPSPVRGTQLGIILYSFPFPYFRSPKLSVQSAQQDGIVRDGMQFHLIKLVSRGKLTDCTYCGRLFINEPLKLQLDHLSRHLKAVLL
jgi:hypothetical protein